MVSISTVALTVPLGDAEPVGGELEGVVPEPRLQVALQLGEVQVDALAPFQQPPGPVGHEQPEVDQAARGRPAVDLDVLLGQVPAPGPRHQGGHLVVQAVAAAVRALEADRALDGVDQVPLAAEHVLPGRGVGVLEVGHEHPGPGVEGVDQHLAVGRPGDLDPPVGQPLDRRDPPVPLPHRRRPGKEVGQLPGVERRLALAPPGQQLLPGRPQLPLQLGHQPERVVAQDVPVLLPCRTVDLNTVRGCHRRPPLTRRLRVLHCIGAACGGR